MLDRIYGELFGSRTLGADLLAEDVEWANPPDAVERGVRRGIDSFNDATPAAHSDTKQRRPAAIGPRCLSHVHPRSGSTYPDGISGLLSLWTERRQMKFI